MWDASYGLGLMVFVVLFSGAARAQNLRESQSFSAPNVILVMTDDQGWGDFGCHGNLQLDTPRLDQFAGEGVSFERFYVSPVCAPTRASLLTGRYSLRTGVHGVTRGRETMRASEWTIAEHYRSLGYATGCFGKWHSGAHYPHDPLGQGFDEFVGFCGGHLNNYFDPLLQCGHELKRTDGFITDVLTDAALDFVRRHQHQPFFCYLPYNAPHSPFQAPQKEFDKYKQQGLDDQLACVYAMCENIDHNFGRILDTLTKLKLEQDTIVVFLTDNGPNSDRFNGGLAQRKASVNEGGVRVPCFLRYPREIPPGSKVPWIAADIDIFPSLMALDVPRRRPGNRSSTDSSRRQVAQPQDGTIWSVERIADPTPLSDRRTFFSHHTPALQKVEPYPAAVRTDRFTALNPAGQWQLFRADPSSGIPVGANIADRLPAELRRMRLAYEHWYGSVTAAGFDRIPIEVGHDLVPEVPLPAHEADIIGGGPAVSYCDGRGWCHAWVSVADHSEADLAWPVKFIEDATYTIRAQLAVPPEWVGGVIRADFDGDAVEWTIDKPIPATEIANQDRVPRSEAQERNWQAVPLGQLRLIAGASTLHLTAQPPESASAVANGNLDIKSVIITKD